MEWEHKFTNIVKDTESNLAKVKERLSFPMTPSHPGLNNGLNNHTATPTSDLPGHYNGSINMSTPSYAPMEQSHGVIMVLQDRLDDQARAIEHLTRTYKRLEDDKDTYHRKFKDLRDELNQVLSRLSERGVDLNTERKLDQWRRDMASEVQGLQTQLQLYKHDKARNAGENSDISLAISRETHEIRRHMQDEVEGFRREMDMFRNKLGKLEMELSTVDSESKDVSRRQTRLDKQLRDVLDSQNLTNKDLNRTKGDLHQEREQVDELKSTYRSLRDKLGQLESHMSDDSNHRSSTSSRKSFPRKSRANKKSAVMVATPTTSEIFSSDSDLDDLEDIKTSELYQAPTRDTRTEPQETVTDDDYLLTDLNLTDELTSDGDTLDLNDL